MRKPQDRLSMILDTLERVEQTSDALIESLKEAESILNNLVRHDRAADDRAGLPHCSELETAIEWLDTKSSTLTKEDA